MKIFSGSANEELAEKIAQFLGEPLGKIEKSRFADGEIRIEIKENVRGKDIFIVQPTSFPVNDNFMELLIMADAFKRASANMITAVIPYYGYARQDKKDKPRVPITAKLIADLLEASGVRRMVSVDVHAEQIQGFFNFPVDHLFAVKIFIDHFRKMDLKDLVIVSPDAGGTTRGRAYAKRLGVELAIIDKRRPMHNQSEVLNIIGDVKDKNAIIVDDMIDTAGTLVKAAQAIRDKGGKEIFAACTHPVLSGNAIEKIRQSVIKKLFVTDTIFLSKEKQDDKIEVLSLANLLGEATRRIYNKESISSLFSD